MVQNKCFLFAEIPQALPVPGKHLRVRAGDFDLDAAPAEGGFTGRVLHASLDPYLRHRMVSADAARDGFEPLPVGSVIPNTCIIRVLQSKSPSLAPGDAVIGMAPIQEYVTVSADDAKQYTKIENPHGLALKMFLGPLGLPGLTAYSALYEVAKPQKGETIFISAALGAVGQMVGQLSKREGLNVIGSVGSDEKLKVLVEKLGYDAGFNYRHGDIEGQLKRLAPDGIDIHYDNVGGEQLDAAITLMKSHGRIVQCGYSSQYNIPPDQQYRLRNYTQIISKMVVWRGLLVFDKSLGDAYRVEHQQNVSKWIAERVLEPILSETEGIDNAPSGLVELLEGKNNGKSVLNIAQAE